MTNGHYIARLEGDADKGVWVVTVTSNITKYWCQQSHHRLDKARKMMVHMLAEAPACDPVINDTKDAQ